MPCPCCGTAHSVNCGNYNVEAEWNGLTMTMLGPNPFGSNPGVSSGGNGSDEYRLGIFRPEYYGGIVACFLGSWAGGCVPVPNNANLPIREECIFTCECVDLDTNSPCEVSTTSPEYILSGYVVTIYNPAAQDCAEHYRSFGCGFRGQMSVWKYTYVTTGGEASGEADVEEMLYADVNGMGAYSFIPCSGYTPTAPTVTLYFP